MRYTFIVFGKPQPKQRPRFNRYSGVAYTPRETHEYERSVRDAFRVKYPRAVKILGALTVSIDAYFEPPNGASKIMREKMLSGEVRPAKKPDADNLIKSICDAMNGVAYVDDGQVVSVSCRKLYSNVARVEVVITDERS